VCRAAESNGRKVDWHQNIFFQQRQCDIEQAAPSREDRPGDLGKRHGFRAFFHLTLCHSSLYCASLPRKWGKTGVLSPFRMSEIKPGSGGNYRDNKAILKKRV
jgi:hypothetical protein